MRSSPLTRGNNNELSWFYCIDRSVKLSQEWKYVFDPRSANRHQYEAK